MEYTRYLMIVSYLGTNYQGWQRQPNAVGVQQVIEDALSLLLGAKIEVVAVGRTDTGVHGAAMTIHFDIDHFVLEAKNILFSDLPKLIYSLNAMLPQDISVSDMYEVNQDFHARFSALSRTYRYSIHSKKDPFKLSNSWYYKRKLDQLAVDRMNLAASYLVGAHNFQSFSKVKTDVKTFDCTIYYAHWEVMSPDCSHLIFHVRANRFLRGMVRAIVGTLVEIGLGLYEPEKIIEILSARDRSYAGTTAPANGLTFVSAEYPDEVAQ